MEVGAITYTLLTVGSVEPVAKGKLEAGGQKFQFSLIWDRHPVLRAEFPSELCQKLVPDGQELNELKTTVIQSYRALMCRALYGGQQPSPRKALSVNLQVLRLGHGLGREAAAKRLDVRTSTINDMESGRFDFEADIWRYAVPADSLLYRAASLYRVPQIAVQELPAPLFFLRNRIRLCSYDFGREPLYKELFSFWRFNQE